MSLTVRPVTDASSEADLLAVTVQRVQAYVRGEPAGWTALAQAVQDDAEGTTRALLALSTVLLDISAGAFALSPVEVLEKVSGNIARSEQDRGSAMSPQ